MAAHTGPACARVARHHSHVTQRARRESCVVLKQPCTSAMMGPVAAQDPSSLGSKGGTVVVRKGGQRIVRTGPRNARPGVEDQTVQGAGRDVSSSHDTAAQRAELIKPRTIWLVTAIIAGLA